MFSKALVIGDTGMAGKAFVQTFQRQGVKVVGMSRQDSDLICDITTQSNKMIAHIINYKPDIVVNCAACVSLYECELNPLYAKSINAEAVKSMVRGCSEINARFVQVSTDHYYHGDDKYLHLETDTTVIKNNYALTKLTAEKYALAYWNAVVLRTNITGFRRNPIKPTFIEWLLDSIRHEKSLKLFTDFFTCTIDCMSFAELALLVAAKDFSGILNIASSECLTKKEFALALYQVLGMKLPSIQDGSIQSLIPARANSLGLNCRAAELLLGLNMPDSLQVINNLLNQEQDCFY